MKQRNIPDYSYFSDIVLIVGTNAELDRWIKRRAPALRWKNTSSGKWIHSHDGVNYILISKRHNGGWQIAVLAHEVLHLTFYVLKSAGIRYCASSEEAFTYYFQSIFSQCLKHLSA